MKDPKTGIIVVTYNSELVINNCLKSLFRNSYPDMEVVVVDNASSDETVPTIRKYFKKVHIITNKTNTGFGAANNIGIKLLLKKDCDFIVLLNPDTISSPNLIRKLISVFENDEKIAVAGCIITYAKNNKKIWFAGGYFNRLFCFTRHRYMNQSLNNANVKSGKVDFITGACMMISSEVIKNVGFIPEKYFLYFEDVFFCKKIIDKGFSCYLIAESLVNHHVSTSTGIRQTNKMTPLRAYYFARNPLLYIRGNVNGYLKLTGFIGQFFIRFPFYSYKILKEKNVTSFYYYCKGVADGLRGISSNSFLNKA